MIWACFFFLHVTRERQKEESLTLLLTLAANFHWRPSKTLPAAPPHHEPTRPCLDSL